VCWTYHKILGKKQSDSYLYRQGNLTNVCANNKCNVDFNDETDRYTLMINSVQLYDAGDYECSECFRSVARSAELIVLLPAAETGGIQIEQIRSVNLLFVLNNSCLHSTICFHKDRFTEQCARYGD